MLGGGVLFGRVVFDIWCDYLFTSPKWFLFAKLNIHPPTSTCAYEIKHRPERWPVKQEKPGRQSSVDKVEV